jgi:hypothetical protein
MKVRLMDTSGAPRLLKDIAWTLSGYGNVEIRDDSVILSDGSIVTCKVRQIVETFEVEFKLSPNISGVNDVPVYIYPRYLLLSNIESLRMLLVETTIEIRQTLLVLVKLTDIGLLRNPKYIGVVVNIDKDGDRYKPVSHKVMVNIGGIGYEVVVTGRRVTYRITFSKFDLFKAFADVVIPEFLESRGEVRE